MTRAQYKLFESLLMVRLELMQNPNAVIAFMTCGEPITELKQAIEKLQQEFPGMTVEWHDCNKPKSKHAQAPRTFTVIDDPCHSSR